MTTAYRCAVCGAEVAIATPWPWRCPRATSEDRAHVLRIVRDARPEPPDRDENPFVAYRRRMAWHAFALAVGMTDDDTIRLVRVVSAAVAAVDGRSYATTPFEREPDLSDAMGFESGGGLWVKDETNNVAGSHKARHLLGVLLHLLVAEAAGVAPTRTRPTLAIASCGNAAVAAATLAAAAQWPIDVFVPVAADPGVIARLDDLGAGIVTARRRPADPPGDPCIHRFRAAVDAGAIPFSVQGPDDALCLDGGRTIGWEIAAQLDDAPLDRVFVQVGGGALATSIGDAFRDEFRWYPRLHPVQTVACAPLARAWQRACHIGVAAAGRHWHECMRPWDHPSASAASGILDDETYDWLGVLDAMGDDGFPVVVTEDDVVAANELAARATSVAVDHTGSAGLAGVAAMRRHIGDVERVAVLFTGRRGASQRASMRAERC